MARCTYAGDDAAFDLELEATGTLAELDPEHDVARAGGMAGYEQPVRVTGSATVRDARIELDGLGQRGHSWGAPDWDRIELARTVSAWLGDDLAVSLTAIRPAGKRDHAAEAVAASVLERGEDGERRTLAVADPRLSTIYDAEGRQRRAGLELWIDEDGWPRRAAGEIACGTSLDLGRLRLDCAFFRWRMEGREGVGRYDVLRRGVRSARLVVGAQPVPEVELEALARELHRPLAREARQHGVERLLLGHAGVEGLLAAEAGRDLQRLAAVLAERRRRR